MASLFIAGLSLRGCSAAGLPFLWLMQPSVQFGPFNFGRQCAGLG